MKHSRLAAIDIGTNSIRAIVIEACPDGEFRILDDEKATVRLGEGLSTTGKISSGARERAREALLRMKKIFAGLDVGYVEAVATSAVRSATNGDDFILAGTFQANLSVSQVGVFAANAGNNTASTCPPPRRNASRNSINRSCS